MVNCPGCGNPRSAENEENHKVCDRLEMRRLNLQTRGVNKDLYAENSNLRALVNRLQIEIEELYAELEIERNNNKV